MYCSKCGSEIESNAKFCATCGSPINADENSGYNQKSSESTMMSPATTSVVAYMTWIGFIIALCAGDKNGAKFFLNQALVFNIFCMACIIPVIGWLWAIYMLVCFILGVIWAAEQTEKRLPLIGKLIYCSNILYFNYNACMNRIYINCDLFKDRGVSV